MLRVARLLHLLRRASNRRLALLGGEDARGEIHAESRLLIPELARGRRGAGILAEGVVLALLARGPRLRFGEEMTPGRRRRRGPRRGHHERSLASPRDAHQAVHLRLVRVKGNDDEVDVFGDAAHRLDATRRRARRRQPVRRVARPPRQTQTGSRGDDVARGFLQTQARHRARDVPRSGCRLGAEQNVVSARVGGEVLGFAERREHRLAQALGRAIRRCAPILLAELREGQRGDDEDGRLARFHGAPGMRQQRVEEGNLRRDAEGVEVASGAADPRALRHGLVRAVDVVVDVELRRGERKTAESRLVLLALFALFALAESWFGGGEEVGGDGARGGGGGPTAPGRVAGVEGGVQIEAGDGAPRILQRARARRPHRHDERRGGRGLERGGEGGRG